MNSKKLENLYMFKIMWEQLYRAESKNIRDIAIQRWIDSRGAKESAIDSLEYAIDSVVNRLIEEELESLKALSNHDSNSE